MMRLLALCAAGLIVSACVPSDIVPQTNAIADSSLGLGETPAPPVAQEWWKAFGDPQLDRLADAALTGNPTLEDALARLRAAQAEIDSARSQLYPQVTYQAEDQLQRFSRNYIIPPPFAGTTNWMGTEEANLSWNLDFWGKQASQIRKAKALARAAEYDAAGARLALAGALAQAYIGLDRAYKLGDVAADNQKEQQELVSLTDRRVKSGLDSLVEQKEADALLAQAHQYREQADAAREVAVHEIAALIGHGADVYGSIGRPSVKLDTALALPNELPADLLGRRPDVLAARARIQAMIAGRKVAAAEFYPDVDLLGFAGTAAIGLAPLFRLTSAAYGAGPAITLPIFDAGKLRSEYAVSTADLDQAVADYNGTLTGAVRQTADALTQIRSLDRQAADQESLLADTSQGYRMAETRYRTGLTNQLTVFNAETVFLQAREQQVALDADSVTQRVTLLLAVGGGFDPKNSNPAQTHSNQDVAP
ncbi:MAG: efflux transporter outer membrane subunit [Rhizomicrobium sp.]|jgi:NodT family efflux transporter outer membrane factor (OMF) lipoprotein